MWSKNAAWSGRVDWWQAIQLCNGLAWGASCGVTHTDWRLPNVNELESLRDMNKAQPALPHDHPFANVQNESYWTSTTNIMTIDYAWIMNAGLGGVSSRDKFSEYYIWPVRGGN
jgi:hypothetical protein